MYVTVHPSLIGGFQSDIYTWNQKNLRFIWISYDADGVGASSSLS